MRHIARRQVPLMAGILFLALFVVLAILVVPSRAQNGPHISAIDPASAKVNESVTLTGMNLGKGSVAGVFLSDDKSDYKATIMDQGAEKIVLKVPDVKPGGYNISVQVGGQLLILPVKITIT